MTKAKSGSAARKPASRKSTEGDYGSSGVRSSDYADKADYAQALRAAGGPGRDEFYRVSTSSLAGALLTATFGANHFERNEALLAEAKREQEKRPHVFLRKR